MQVLADIFAASFALWDFDLSRNQSLRTLDVRARYLDSSSLLTYALSVIASTAFSEVTVFYQNFDEVEEVSAHHRRFEVLQAMHSVRAFQLVLCAHVRNYGGGYPVRTLKEALEAEKAKMGCDGVLSEPSVFHRPRETEYQFYRNSLSPL